MIPLPWFRPWMAWAAAVAAMAALLGLPVAAGMLHVFGGPMLSPMIAGAAMAMSSSSPAKPTKASSMVWS